MLSAISDPDDDYHSLLTDAMGKLQTDLALALPSYACNDKLRLSGIIDILNELDRLFHCG